MSSKAIWIIQNQVYFKTWRNARLHFKSKTLWPKSKQKNWNPKCFLLSKRKTTQNTKIKRQARRTVSEYTYSIQLESIRFVVSWWQPLVLVNSHSHSQSAKSSASRINKPNTQSSKQESKNVLVSIYTYYSICFNLIKLISLTNFWWCWWWTIIALIGVCF